MADLDQNCRAYPDEKGIETVQVVTPSEHAMYCRAYPDEKGIETGFACLPSPGDPLDCRAYPDEKGIETRAYGQASYVAVH